MAMGEVGQILEGLKISQTRRAQQISANQEVERIQIERQNQEQRAQQLQDDLKERQRQFDISQKLAKSLHDVQIVQHEQNISKGLQEGNIPAGASLQQTPPGTLSPYQTYNVPGLDNPVTILSPEAYRQKLGADKAAIEKPSQDAALEKQAELQKDLDARTTKSEEARAAREKLLQEQKDAAAALRTNVTAKARVAAAQINAAKKKEDPTLENFDPQPYIQGALDGTYSNDEIRKLGKGQAALVNQGIAGTGTVAISPDQKKFLEGLAPALEIVPKMDQVNGILNQNPIEARVPFTETKNNVDNLIQQIQSGVISASTGAFGQSARAMQQAIKADTGAFTPSSQLGNVSSANQQKRDAYVKLLNDSIDAKLGNLPAGQRQHIKEKLGLDKLIGGQGGLGGLTVMHFDAQGNQIQ